MYAAVFQKSIAKSQSLRTVMVAADDENRQISLGQPTQKIVKQRHRLRRRYALIVDIPCDQHRIRLFGVNDL